MPQKWVFPLFVIPKIFSKNRALSLLCPYDVLNLCRKLEKKLMEGLLDIYGRKDGGTDGGTSEWTGVIT